MSSAEEKLERIIMLVREVIDKNLDPFEVDVVELFKEIRRHLKDILRDLRALVLDAEAISSVSELILRQNEWIKHRSSLLYVDPLLILAKVDTLDKLKLAQILLKAWHPIISLSQISIEAIEAGMEYWRNLSLGEYQLPGEVDISSLTLELGIPPEEEIEDVMRELYSEIRNRKEIDYWRLVISDTFHETIRRAQALSFLVSMGSVSMRYDPTRGTYIVSVVENGGVSENCGPKSVVMVINRNLWRRKRTEYEAKEKT